MKVNKINKFKKAVSFFAVASVFTMASCQKEDMMENQFAQQGQQPADTENIENGKIIEGQYIVVYQDNASRTAELTQELMQEANIADAEMGLQFKGKINGFSGKLNKAQLDKLRSNPNVLSVEPDRIIALSKGGNGGGGGGKPTKDGGTTTTDPEPTTTEPTTTTTTTTTSTTTSGTYNTITVMAGETIPWGVAKVGYGDGTGKVVWVIDSGIDATHADLNVDAARGVSFVSGLSPNTDGFGHGTRVAGIIGAKNNGSGVIGVASNASLISLRVFNDSGSGTLSAAISAVNHVISHGKAGDVVNMSLGGGVSTTLDNAVLNAASIGIRFAIAAGNSAIDCSNNSPARVNGNGIYTISNIDEYDRFFYTSNFGAPVDFAAPGVSVYTTYANGSYGYGTGTSYSAPHVAGILALKGTVSANGYAIGDPDGNADPIASLN
jgi:subtilisin family serine protease